MLEQREEVVALLKEVMKTRGMNKPAHVDFRPLLPDAVGWLEPNDPSPIWQNAPVGKSDYVTQPAETNRRLILFRHPISRMKPT